MCVPNLKSELIQNLSYYRFCRNIDNLPRFVLHFYDFSIGYNNKKKFFFEKTSPKDVFMLI